MLSHTADTGIEATADSPAALIQELATGMFGLIATIGPRTAEQWIAMRVESATFEDLVVDTLSELLYHFEVGDIFFCEFRVDMEPGTLVVTVEAGGVPIHTVEPAGPPIKAVTYHRLTVEERGQVWYARVYFDV